VRISVPNRPALRNAFQHALSDPSLRQALNGLEISLDDRSPNVLVRGRYEALNCPGGCRGQSREFEPAPPVEAYPAGACGSLAGLERREALAREITGGRLTYLRDGVDFAGQRPNFGGGGFTLVDRSQTIQGGVCLINDGYIDNPSVPSIHRDVFHPLGEAVAHCLLTILGIDVSAANAERLSVVSRPNDSRVALWAIEALSHLYGPPTEDRRPD
jgi:hypothetical protein